MTASQCCASTKRGAYVAMSSSVSSTVSSILVFGLSTLFDGRAVHHQGIIHRDIKPSNLLWTADRRTVKIADFGVAHFSYAQRLAAAGQGMVDPADEDPILMDDTDLSKTAGTPMFLAPEIVSDTTEPAASSSTVNVSETATVRPRRRQPITKAIDVWAFGVTLYGLLFGHLPFQADREYEIYQIIRRNDWTVDPTMGVDHIETGGRYQRPQPRGQETEGYLAVKLLEGLLEKDARKRITLEQVKVGVASTPGIGRRSDACRQRHPWILRDMQDPEGWLRETQLESAQSLEPTADETSSAMSSVRFRWTKPLRRFWQGVRPTRSFLSRHVSTDVDEYKHVGVRSAPTHSLSRRRSTTGASQHERRRDRSKSRFAGRDAPRNKSTTDVGSRHAHDYMYAQDWVTWDATRLAAPVPKRRRGSFPSNLRPSRAASPQPSPVSATTPSMESSSPEDRPPSRLSLTSWFKRPFRSRQPATPIEQTPSSGSSNQSMTRRRSGQRLARRSEDAFNTVAPSRQSTASGQLNVAMRAASWGEMADYARPSEDVMSVYSAERADDALDDDTFLLGAGGIAHSPVLSIPTSGVLSTVSSIASLNGPHTTAPPTPATISVAQALLQRTAVGELPSAPDPAVQDPASLARQSQMRSRATSPLAQVSYNPVHIPIATASSESDDSSSFDDDDVEEDDDTSSYGAEVDRQPSTSQRYQEEDEESEEEGEVRLELRGRRPSQSASEMSPVRGGPDTPHRERPMICT